VGYYLEASSVGRGGPRVRAFHRWKGIAMAKGFDIAWLAKIVLKVLCEATSTDVKKKLRKEHK
jgi:hypothetical protein